MVAAIHLVGLEVVSLRIVTAKQREQHQSKAEEKKEEERETNHLDKDITHLDVCTAAVLDTDLEEGKELRVEAHQHLDVGKDVFEDCLRDGVFQSQGQDENLFDFPLHQSFHSIPLESTRIHANPCESKEEERKKRTNVDDGLEIFDVLLFGLVDFAETVLAQFLARLLARGGRG